MPTIPSNLQHLHLHVRDRSVSEFFYARWMGMRVARRGASLTFMVDDLGFELALMEDNAPQALPSWFHFGFRLPSGAAVVAMQDEMVVSGLAIVQPLYEEQDFASFRVADPDGYTIEFYWELPGAALG